MKIRSKWSLLVLLIIKDLTCWGHFLVITTKRTCHVVLFCVDKTTTNGKNRTGQGNK